MLSNISNFLKCKVKSKSKQIKIKLYSETQKNTLL